MSEAFEQVPPEFQNKAPYEPTPEEKELIGKYLDVERTGSWQQKELLFEQIRNKGNKLLPYLHTTLVTEQPAAHSNFVFARFADDLAKPEDLSMILDTIQIPGILNDFDWSASGKLLSTIRRLTNEIRETNPSDQRIQHVHSILVSLLDKELSQPYLEIEIRDLANKLIPSSVAPNMRSFQEDLWEDESEDEEYIPLYGWNRYGIQNALEDTGNPLEIDYLQTVLNYEGLTAEEVEKICTKANDLTERFIVTQINFPPTARLAVATHIFNFLHQYPAAQDHEIIKDAAKHSRFLESENLEEQQPDKASIGIEVEIPVTQLPLSQTGFDPLVKFLTQNGMDISYETDMSVELRFPPSYSAATQARSLYELQRANIIPTTTKKFASLHINLGLTRHLNGFRTLDDDVAIALSDLITYGYVTEGRVRTRENAESILSHNQYADSQTRMLSKNKGRQRLEFRTPRVLTTSTYRLLHLIQDISPLLNDNTPEGENMRKEFLTEVTERLYKTYSIRPNLPEEDQDTAANLIRDAYQQRLSKHPDKEEPAFSTPDNIADDARKLLVKYVNKAKELNPAS